MKDAETLHNAILKHYNQRAEDRCWMDDNELYTAAGLPEHNNWVGDKFAMLTNCIRFINHRTEECGPWKSYAELEAEIERLRSIIRRAYEGDNDDLIHEGEKLSSEKE